MEYRNLYHFVHIAQEKNFSKAAEKILTSQSALTRSVQALEKEFNIILINRSTHYFQLTDAGEYLFKEGTKILNSFEKLENQMNRYSEDEKKILSLGVPTVLNTLLAPILMSFQNQNINRLRLNLIVEGSIPLSEKVMNESLDVSLIMKSFGDNRFDTYPVITDHLVVVVPPEHPLATMDIEIDIKDLRDETFVLLDETYQINASFMAMCREAGYSPKISTLSSNWDFLAQLVSSGGGITIFPNPILPIFGRHLKGIPIKGNHGLWQIVAITKRWEHIDNDLKNLIRFLQDNYQTTL